MQNQSWMQNFLWEGANLDIYFWSRGSGGCSPPEAIWYSILSSTKILRSMCFKQNSLREAIHLNIKWMHGCNSIYSFISYIFICGFIEIAINSTGFLYHYTVLLALSNLILKRDHLIFITLWICISLAVASLLQSYISL